MHTRYSLRFSILGLTILLLLSSVFVHTVRADPCAILHVSLPDGTYHGPHMDPWLSECWLLNLTGISQTFTVRINNTSASKRSYNTRVIIALNEAGHNNLQTLVVYGTTVPKSSFTYGTPRPFNLWNWPSGDVYPTWYSTYVNVGTINRKGYKDISVSVSFSDAAGVKMHFDAYGSTVSYTPSSSGYIAHNPISADSTVLFQTGAPPPQPPIVNFFHNPSYPNTDEMVTFNASESFDPDGYIVSYSWDFGDGSPIVTESDPITTHIYAAFGNYTVTLTVTDDESLTDEATSTVSVIQPPVAAFTYSPPDPLWHEVVTFDASASTADGGVIVSYMWDFGNGNITTVTNPVIEYTYPNLGTFTVTLNVTDSEGKWDTESKPITIEGLPLADFWWTPYYPERLESVAFNASDSTPDGGTIVSYAWDFGDGTPIVVESDPETTHSYAMNGSFTVTLNITDSEGRWDIESKIITVIPLHHYLTVNTDPPSITTIPGEGWYNEGTNVLLTAPDIIVVSPGVRYKFSHWDVDSVSQGSGVNPITVTMNVNHAATAHYTLQYYLTVTSSFGTPTGSGWYNSGTTVYASLNVGIADHGNGTRRVFTYWSVDTIILGTNYAQSDPIFMDGPKNVVANWKTQYLLEVLTAPPSLSPQPTRNPEGEPGGSWWYDASTSVTLTAQPISGYTFSHWDVDGNSKGSGVNPTTVSMNGSHTATAHYTAMVEYYLTVKTNPSSVTTISGEGWYSEGENVVLTGPEFVTVSSGVRYRFSHWDVDSVSQGFGVNPITVTMNANHTGTAHYILQYYLTVTSPYGSPTPLSNWFDAGTSINALVTTPWAGPTGTRFVSTGWTGTGSVPISGTTNSVSFAINAPSSITWNWKTQYYLTVKTDPSGITTISGEGWYDASTSVPLTAPSVTGYAFLHWDVDGALKGTGVKSISVTMNSPHTATAHYKLISVVVGGSTFAISSSPLPAWISLNVLLIAAIFLTASLLRRKAKKNS